MTSATNTASSSIAVTAATTVRALPSGRGNAESQSSALWQTYVLPSVNWGDAADTIIRVDNEYANVAGPHYLDCWHADVGWHRRLQDLAPPPLPSNEESRASTGALSGSSAELPPSPALRFDTDNDSLRSNESLKLNSEIEDRIAEVAHDIRSPIAVAKQIVSAVAQQAQSTGTLSGGEIELLEIAASRLVEANKWAEGVLVQRCLQDGTPINIRRRFYPTQWKAAVQPLFHGLAVRKRIRLQWTGWDRSLPRLYLDENQLTRIVLNLVTNAIEASRIGSEIAIRVAVQNNVTQQLVLAIEDKGQGLSESTLKQINSNSLTDFSQTSTGSGFGLGVAKSLIASLGGRLRAESSEAGGTLIRLTLPTDSPQSLLRSWLVQGMSTQDAQRLSGSVEMYAVRCTGLSPQFVDTQLQQSAGGQDFVYRVGVDRWLWMTRSSSNVRSEGLPAQLDDSLRRLRHMQGRSLTHRTCNGQLVYRIQCSDADLPTDDLTKRVTEIAHLLSSQIERVMGGRVPSVDDLSIQAGSIVFRTNEQGGTRQVRQDMPGAVPRSAMSRHRSWDAGGQDATISVPGKPAGEESPSEDSTRRRVDSEGTVIPDSKSSVVSQLPGGEPIAVVQQDATPALVAGRAQSPSRSAMLPSQKMPAVLKDPTAQISSTDFEKAILEVNDIWKKDRDIIARAHVPLSESKRG
ncbi:MAG TPA: hypothetical protein DDW52_04590 [Planctomycetaceae bacterium]|nr:hypothetical protein [Planctomycetaceae bacterium]